jgi:hypothetical protein
VTAARWNVISLYRTRQIRDATTTAGRRRPKRETVTTVAVGLPSANARKADDTGVAASRCNPRRREYHDSGDLTLTRPFAFEAHVGLTPIPPQALTPKDFASRTSSASIDAKRRPPSSAQSPCCTLALRRPHARRPSNPTSLTRFSPETAVAVLGTGQGVWLLPRWD